MKKKNNRKAFTLTEVLVSVAIIVLLITLSVIATFSSRMHSRNSKRVNNVNEIMSALESYYAANQSYPTAITAGQPIMSGSTELLKRVPTNPYPRTDGGCPNQDYTYTTTSTGYKLTFCIGANHGRFAQGTVICKNGNCGVADSDCGPGVTVTDRDGFTYNTLKFGNKCWLAENLKTNTKPGGVSIRTGVGWWCSSPSSPCIWGTSYYWYSERFCMNLGNLPDCGIGQGVYTWYAAMNVNYNDPTPPEGSQGICPDGGWHIPTHNELTDLERSVCTSATCATDFPYDTTTTGARGTNEGQTLHDTTGFNFGYMGGIDAYSGASCPTGWDGGTYCTGGIRYHFGIGGDIWSSTTSTGVAYPAAWIRNINTAGMPQILRLKDYSKFDKLSVRCVKDVN